MRIQYFQYTYGAHHTHRDGQNIDKLYLIKMTVSKEWYFLIFKNDHI